MRKIEAAQRRVNGVIGTLYCGLGVGVAADALRRLSLNGDPSGRTISRIRSGYACGADIY
ncbi:MAG: hypothetical protein L3J30_14430 [Marinosulfonomonas sp.]|nr:hypothetical protein [Marinosulfonomonas sp.]